jgi:cyanophycin synthetase
VLIFGDALRRTWKQIIHFVPNDAEAAVAEAPSHFPVEAPELPSMGIDEGMSFIRDERGVRLARDVED